MSDIKLTGAAENAISKLQNTPLSPMDEALFQAWAKANQIKKTDLPDDIMDYRGVYKGVGGTVLPHGELQQIAARTNDAFHLQRVLQERAQDKIKQLTQQKVGELDAAAQSRNPVSKPGQ